MSLTDPDLGELGKNKPLKALIKQVRRQTEAVNDRGSDCPTLNPKPPILSQLRMYCTQSRIVRTFPLNAATFKPRLKASHSKKYIDEYSPSRKPSSRKR
ncbi:MAG: hypothetical protein RIE73_22520 [Coleofasciculus sp. C1-SOL-03]|jgi:hypothetical protein|uniref:hypothetical protein n=1 Tax=Coleofasciculus sp. C1-SOL-03 TaxID=3069522 RepID=UPI0032F999F1